MKLKTNNKAPNFVLPSTTKEKFSLKDFLGKYIVIYFYPKDDTPGCTIETNDFNKLLSKFKKLNCEVYGISKDSLKSHDKFRDKYKIKFDLLADEELKVLKKYKITNFPSESFKLYLTLLVEGKVKFEAFIILYALKFWQKLFQRLAFSFHFFLYI